MNYQLVQLNFSSCNNIGSESFTNKECTTTHTSTVPSSLLPGSSKNVSSSELPSANLLPETTSNEESDHLPKICTKGGVKKPFPVKLWELLDHIDNHEPEIAHIISWQSDGRCFRVHDKKMFETKVQSNYFDQSNYTSFRRQLNLWGFKRVSQRGVNCGAYFHPLCRRGEPYLCRMMRRPEKEPKTPNNSKRPSFTAAIRDGKTACATPPPPLKAGGAAANIITPTLIAVTPTTFLRVDNSIANLQNNCNLALQGIGGGDGCSAPRRVSMYSWEGIGNNQVENFARIAENTNYHQIQDHEDIIEPIEDVNSYQESSLLSMQFASYMKDALEEDFTEIYE
ncbi:hypothetical protein CTEN210_10609 [Chaetoceros tenuissimus]|uniref:HSF-type DNA-binding domain-containing protein n=1 Tax=Chaetoceros tenuissimus TaxID=426638 RepID=A0AAD3CY00_9STRA|nr:hypothetical protein CTEN210_10609 [Chaetoceros tenuissimus]